MEIIKRQLETYQQKIYKYTTVAMEHMMTNLLIHSKDYILAKFKQHFTINYVFKLGDMDTDTYFKVVSIIEYLDPDSFAKHEFMTVNGYRQLRTGSFYPIFLKKINAIIIVDTRDHMQYIDNEKSAYKISLCFIGKGARIAEKLFLNTLIKDGKAIPKEKDNLKSKNVRINVVEFYLDSDRDICSNSTNESLGKDESNIFTTDSNKQQIFNYLDKFIHASRLFENMGVTYKTGILLYGPPGTGKTSMAKAICGKYNLTMYIIKYSLFDMEMMNRIRCWRSGKKRPFVILFDDIDCVFGKREEDRTQEEKVKSQELLEILDGANSIDNAIFIATTNDYTALDPALVRDGRFNLKINMDNISKELAISMCRNMHIKETEIKSFLEDEAFPINPAYLQNKIIQHIFENLDSIDLNTPLPSTEELTIQEKLVATNLRFGLC